MSPRAACRLEHFGFDRVFDYVDRIADWKASGFAVEGSAEPELRVADATRPDIPTCRPDEPIDEVRPRVVATGWDACVVIDCDGVVVGRLRPAARENNGRLTAQQEMEPGPTTVRPDGLLQPLVDRMKKRDTPQVLVTTPRGLSSACSCRMTVSGSSPGSLPPRSGVTVTDAPADGQPLHEPPSRHVVHAPRLGLTFHPRRGHLPHRRRRRHVRTTRQPQLNQSHQEPASTSS